MQPHPEVRTGVCSSLWVATLNTQPQPQQFSTHFFDNPLTPQRLYDMATDSLSCLTGCWQLLTTYYETQVIFALTKTRRTDIFWQIFYAKNCFFLQISLINVLGDPLLTINHHLAQIMAWRWTRYKPLSEPMMAYGLLMQISTFKFKSYSIIIMVASTYSICMYALWTHW